MFDVPVESCMRLGFLSYRDYKKLAKVFSQDSVTTILKLPHRGRSIQDTPNWGLKNIGLFLNRLLPGE